MISRSEAIKRLRMLRQMLAPSDRAFFEALDFAIADLESGQPIKTARFGLFADERQTDLMDRL